MYKVSKWEWSATQGLVFSCMVSVTKLKYPEFSYLQTLLVVLVIFSVVYGTMYLLCRK